MDLEMIIRLIKQIDESKLKVYNKKGEEYTIAKIDVDTAYPSCTIAVRRGVPCPIIQYSFDSFLSEFAVDKDFNFPFKHVVGVHKVEAKTLPEDTPKMKTYKDIVNWNKQIQYYKQFLLPRLHAEYMHDLEWRLKAIKKIKKSKMNKLLEEPDLAMYKGIKESKAKLQKSIKEYYIFRSKLREAQDEYRSYT